MNVNLGVVNPDFLTANIRFNNYADAAPAYEFTQYPTSNDITIDGMTQLINRPKGWKLTTTGLFWTQTINWQGQTFTLTPSTDYYVGYGSDGKPIITATEENLVTVAESFTRAGQFQGSSSENFTMYVEESFDTATGLLTIDEGKNKAISSIPGTASMQYDLQAGDELDKNKISTEVTAYNNMGLSYTDGTNVENKWTYTDNYMTKPINVTTTYTTDKETSLWGYTTIAAVTNGQDIDSSLIVTATYAEKSNEGTFQYGAQYITAGVIGDSSNQDAITYTDPSTAGKIDVAAEELDLDISFTF